MATLRLSGKTSHALLHAAPHPHACPAPEDSVWTGATWLYPWIFDTIGIARDTIVPYDPNHPVPTDEEEEE